MPNQTRLFELALRGLEAERVRIDDEIADLRKRLRLGAATAVVATAAAQPGRRRRRGRLSAAGRKKISDMMKARWAARRKGTQASAAPAARGRRGKLTPAGRKALSEAA